MHYLILLHQGKLVSFEESSAAVNSVCIASIQLSGLSLVDRSVARLLKLW